METFINKRRAGPTRRDFLRLGSVAGLFGSTMTLPRLLAAEADSPTARRNTSVIFLFLKGGMSTIDGWDLKPNAPAEFRGEFNPIETTVPGIQISEHLPQIAQQMHHFSLIRSFGHRNSDHGPADHYMLTGYHPIAGFNPNLSPNNQRPALGSIISHETGSESRVPAYVCLPQNHASSGPAYLGPSAAPFVIEANPAAPDFSVPDLSPPASVATARSQRRKELLASVDQLQKSATSRANRSASALHAFQERAIELMSSPQAKAAFDIHQESDALRDRYGRHTLGQSCLMARRLVEAGVRCVTIDHSNWDTHDNNFHVLKSQLFPALDTGLSTLFADLADRGLLDSTLVIVSGEFGRTPRINSNAGRDHWGPSFTVAIGGGGIRGGIVVGSSDRRAERPAVEPHGPEDLFATICHVMGIAADHEYFTPEGRPVKIVNQGRIIADLV